MTNLSSNAKILIVLHSLHSIIELFINTFLVAYFLHITNNDIVPTALFYIFSYALLGLSFSAIGPAVKGAKKLWLYRLSFVINALALLLIIYFKEQITLYVWLLGVIFGLERALFYFPQNMMTSQENTGDALIAFNGYRYGWNGAIKIIAPLVFGWFITKDSFCTTACFVVVLTLAEFVFSYFLRSIKSSFKPFHLKSLLALALRRKTVSLSLKIEFLRGLIFDALDVLVILYIIYMFKTNLNLGIFTSVFAFCSIVVGFIFGRFGHVKSFMPILLFCSFLTFGGTIYFVADTTKFSFILYNFVFATATQLIRMITDINFYKVSKHKTITSVYRAEYMALRELYLNVGRILGFGIIIAVAVVGAPSMLKYLILVFSFLIALVGYLSMILNNRLIAKSI